MIGYIIKRIGTALLIVWGVFTLTFLLIHLAPGDPASIYISPEISPATIENLRRQMGIDQPMLTQYFSWFQQCLRGNLGISFSYKRPVLELFGETIPHTLQLTLVVFLIQMVVGLFWGVISAIHHQTKLDSVLSTAMLFLYSIPGFWLALLFIFLFSYKLGWLPSGQMFTYGLSGGFWELLMDRLKHLILPVWVLSIPFSAYTARFVRGSFLNIMEQNYIRTAFAYGLSPYRIYFKYVLKNALLPLVTLFGLYLPFILGGAVVTEYIFGWPGMGRLTVEAIFTYDYPVVLACTLLAAISVVLGNLISDVLSKVIDPRIKLQGFSDS